jgi:hypothetical protein
MLISLDKNKWLYDWMQEVWQDDLQRIVFNEEFNVPRPNQLRVKIAQLLETKGYRTKVTSKHDIIISMSEKEFVFLQLKYA